MAISKEFIEKYGFATLEQYRENMAEGETEVMYYQQILFTTDHIPAKLFEDFIETMTGNSVGIGNMIKFFKDIKEKYADVLEARKTAREEINRIETISDL